MTLVNLSVLKYLNFVINSQDKIKNILRNSHDKETLTDMLYKKISHVGCRLGILYGQAKVYKPAIDNFHLLGQYLTLLIHHHISYLNF